jgi:hypothetical protein
MNRNILCFSIAKRSATAWDFSAGPTRAHDTWGRADDLVTVPVWLSLLELYGRAEAECPAGELAAALDGLGWPGSLAAAAHAGRS